MSVKGADFPQELRPFVKTFEGIATRHNYAQVFEDFLTLVMCCYARETEEPLYFETIKRYSKEEVNQFPRLMADLIILYRKSGEPWSDPLGTFYEVLASTYKMKALGQFFTPNCICDMMASINGPGEYDKKRTGLLVNDPACGSGRMLLAYNAKYPDNVYVAEDLDGICVKMTAVNMLFHGCRGEVVHHDSLRPDSWHGGWMVNADMKVTNCPSILRIAQADSLITRVWRQELAPHQEETKVILNKEQPEEAEAVAEKDLKYLF